MLISEIVALFYLYINFGKLYTCYCNSFIRTYLYGTAESSDTRKEEKTPVSCLFHVVTRASVYGKWYIAARRQQTYALFHE
jgi:hypothetical protein